MDKNTLKIEGLVALKACNVCQVQKDEVEGFYPNGNGYRMSKCRQCQIAQNRARRKADPIKYKNSDLFHAFGITLSDYNQMFAQQSGKCAICHIHQGELKRALAVDHCHETGVIRGLLCLTCNSGIGHLKDSEKLLRAAADYVKKHNSGSADKKLKLVK